MISIEGLDKAAVLAALYNAAKPQGMGFLHYDPKPMAVEEARQHLGVGDDHTKEFGAFVHNGNKMCFDYLKGRVMKVNLASDTSFEEGLYDRYNGQGAAARVIDSIRASSGKKS